MKYCFNPEQYSEDFQAILNLKCLEWVHTPSWLRLLGRNHSWMEVGSEVVPGLELYIYRSGSGFSISADGDYFDSLEELFEEVLLLPGSEEVIYQIDLFRKYLILFPMKRSTDR